MKAVIFSAPELKRDTIHELAICNGFSIVEENPEFVLSYGGDGTFMRAEGIWPGIPKVILRGSAVCKLCSSFDNEDVLRRISKGKYSIEEFWKLEVKVEGRKLEGVNDIVVHNGNPRHAIRYKLSVDGRPVGDQVIGDGIVVATPLGSTGYYRSITDSFFETGMGLAFNNSTEQSDHMVLKENSTISVTITRGPAVVYADNKEGVFELKEGEGAEIRKSSSVARIVRVE